MTSSNKITKEMENETKRELGIILTGTKDEVPKDIFVTEFKKIIDREKERGGNLIIKVYYYGEDSARSFVLRMKEYIENNVESGVEIELVPTLKNSWSQGRMETGRRRNERMCSSSNYILCFSPTEESNRESYHRWILEEGRKQKLIVREIYTALSDKNSTPSDKKKILTPGLNLNLNIETITTTNNKNE